MYSADLVKKWKTVEAQLNLAARFLSDQNAFHLPEQSLADYRHNLREKELYEAMILLEVTAKNIGAKSGFWRYIKRVAQTIGDTNKEEEYENEFHRVLSNKV